MGVINVKPGGGGFDIPVKKIVKIHTPGTPPSVKKSGPFLTYKLGGGRNCTPPPILRASYVFLTLLSNNTLLLIFFKIFARFFLLFQIQV
jgi:hypothetical protein